MNTLRKNVVSSLTTCSKTDDKSIFNGDSAIVANAWIPERNILYIKD